MHPCRVCVADDCVDEAAILCEGLGLHNYEAHAVHTGQAALDCCREGKVDLLLLDVGLPDISGYEVCESLKSAPETRDIPVVFVTAKGSGDDVARGYALGAVDYIAKPYNLPIVMLRVDAAMRTWQMVDEVRSQPEWVLDNAYTDRLTGLRNRRFLLERLQEEVEKAHRYNYPLSCLILDVDEIVAVDMELGAASLDDLLVEIAMALRSLSRNYDIIARYDSAIFVAVLPHTPLDDALNYARKIENEIGATTFSDPSFPTQARLRFGIVSCRNGGAKGAEHVLGEAMRGLLKAKSSPEAPLFARDLDASE